MQKLALLFLMAITASMMFSLNSTVLAQSADTPDSAMDQSMNDTAAPEGETTSDQTQDDATSGDQAMTEDGTADTTTEEQMDTTMEPTMAVQSPLQQLIGGTNPHEVQCGEGLQLVYKASNFRPACVKDSTYQVLLQRGWASASVPSDDDLMGMVSNLPQPAPTADDTTDKTPSGEVNMEEGVNVDGQSTTGNDTNPNPQSYSINLSESMEMGAN